MAPVSPQNPTDTDSVRKPLLLVMDDDILFQRQIEFILQHSYRIISSPCAVTADSEVLAQADTIILDLNMPGEDGVSFLKSIATLEPKPKLLIASGHHESILELARSTAAMYGICRTEALQKPVSRNTLMEALARLETLAADCRVRSALLQTFSEHEILAGFHSGQFTVVYQPQIALGSNAVVGIEALARWDHPDHGRLSPAYFIETIEESIDAEAFTLAIAGMAMQDTKQIESTTGVKLKVSVNVPPVVLESDTFIDELTKLLNEHGFPPQRFQCEVTERGLEKSSPAVSASLARLRMKGILLSVDDFGVGQSGLAKLKSSAFDEIKIDRSFIEDLLTSSHSRSIVESIVNLSGQVGLRVVAEGIEDEDTLQKARLLGVANVQGYYFAKPMPSNQLNEWLMAWKKTKPE